MDICGVIKKPVSFTQRLREEKKEERRRRELERKRLRDEERRKWREEDRRKRKEAEKLRKGEKALEKDKEQSKEEPKIKVDKGTSTTLCLCFSTPVRGCVAYEQSLSRALLFETQEFVHILNLPVS